MYVQKKNKKVGKEHTNTNIAKNYHKCNVKPGWFVLARVFATYYGRLETEHHD